MPEHVHHIVKRLILYICICLLAGIGISGMTAFFHTSFSSTSSILFPLLTSFLMVFHITIACFMGMKYWSSKRRLYLTPVSFGFACSALLMLGTLSSYPDWLTCNPAPVVNQNDAVIYYFFRNIMMAVLFMSSIILYYFRQRIMHSWKCTRSYIYSMYSFYVDHYCFIMAILQPFAVAERQFYRRSEPYLYPVVAKYYRLAADGSLVHHADFIN